MKLFTVIFALFICSTFLFAGGTVKEAKFKAFGNCSSCKERIEGALDIKEVKSASWNKKTKMLTVKYDASTITPDSLQQRVASVGHDTEKFKATDESYDELPGCCQYREGKHEH